MITSVPAAAAAGAAVQTGGVLELDPMAAATGSPRSRTVAYRLRQAPPSGAALGADGSGSGDKERALFRVEWDASAGLGGPAYVRLKMLQPVLTVVAFEPKPWGFTVRFDGLPGSALPGLDARYVPRLLVRSQDGGPVGGTVVQDRDGRGFALILGHGMLTPGAYTVLVHAAVSAGSGGPTDRDPAQAADEGGSDVAFDAPPTLRLPWEAGSLQTGPHTGLDDGSIARDATGGGQPPSNRPLMDLGGEFANFALEGGAGALAQGSPLSGGLSNA
jgi:hypothetical protein